eukprot:5370929-Prymnesium_polylepis.1
MLSALDGRCKPHACSVHALCGRDGRRWPLYDRCPSSTRQCLDEETIGRDPTPRTRWQGCRAAVPNKPLP